MSAAAQKGVFPCVFANRLGVRQVIANWQAVFMARKGHSLSSSPSFSLFLSLPLRWQQQFSFAAAST